MTSIVSIDISGDFIRGVEIEKPDSPKATLLRYGEIATPDGVAVESEIYDSELVSQLLLELWEDAKFKSKNVVLSITGRKLILREYETPFESLKQVKATLSFGAADILPTQVDSSILDFYPTEFYKDSKERDHVKGLVIAAPSDPIEKIVKAFSIARLSVNAVEYGPFGAVKALRKARGVENGQRLLVNIRNRSTEVIALRDGIPIMVRIVPNGLSLRNHSENEDGPLEPGQFFGPLSTKQDTGETNTISNVLKGVRTTLEYFEGGGFKPEGIILTGEGARSQELLMKFLPTFRMKPEVLKLSQVLEPKNQEKRDDLIEASLPAMVGAALGGLK